MARTLYRETQKEAFNLTHCYEVLKDRSRWMAIVENPTKTNGTAIDNEGTRGGSQRPRGSKAAKANSQQMTVTGKV